MNSPESAMEKDDLEQTCSFGTASRLTGLSPDLLRAWERRYRAVEPKRTPGGTRRYCARDLDRLRALKAAVDAGHRIGSVARLDTEDLVRLANDGREPPKEQIREVLAAIERLDGIEVPRLLASQFAALGPGGFAKDYAIPLVREIGDRWEAGTLSISAEHLATGALRSILGSALQRGGDSIHGPRVVFGTIPGELHELGLQIAALTAMRAGVTPVFLGSDVPISELVATVDRTQASALALGFIATPAEAVANAVFAIRARLPQHVQFWIGGAGTIDVQLIEGVERFIDLDVLEKSARELCLIHEGSN